MQAGNKFANLSFYQVFLLTDILCTRNIEDVSGKLANEIRQTKPFRCLEEEVFLNLGRTYQVIQEKVAALLKEHQLTPQQYNILRILRGAQPQGLTCTETSERMLSPDPDMTRLFDRMETRQWIVRERSREDRRAIVTRITPAGLELVGQIDQPIDELLHGLLASLGRGRLKELIETLEFLRETAAR